MRTPRVAVIGAGIGGLVGAALLAHRGLQVELFEAAGAPGGKMREVAIGDLRVDAGPTVLTMPWVFEEIFAAAGASLADHVKLEPLQTLARHAWSDGGRLDLCADPEASVAAIRQFAGAGEAEGFRAFLQRARAVYETLEGPFLKGSRPNPISLSARVGLSRLPDLWRISPFTTLWSALGEHFRDPRLRQLFGRYATYCGSSPFRAPATLMLIAHVEQAGVWRVAGGMHRLARSLADLASSRGAAIHYGRRVERIVVERGAVCAVETQDGQRAEADAILFNGDVAALAAGALGPDAARACDDARRAPNSLSALTFALVGRPEGFPLSHHNVFFSDDYRAEFDEILKQRRLPRDPTIYICAQDRPIDGPGPRRARTPVLSRQCAARLGPWRDFRIGARFMRTCDVPAPREDGAVDPQSGRGADTDGSGGIRWDVSGERRSALWEGVARMGGLVRAGGGARAPAGALSRGRQRASGSRSSDGGAFGTAGGGGACEGPDFSVAVRPGGYAWWYVDALSDDRRFALTVIAFVGSVFSPYYHWRGRRDPDDHCAFNVALYGPRGARWAMTERGKPAVHRERAAFAIGPSAMVWRGDALTIEIHEIAAPWPRRVRGPDSRASERAQCARLPAGNGGRPCMAPDRAPCARRSRLRRARSELERNRIF